MFELENCAAFIATNAAKILAEAFENILKEVGITRAQWSVLYFLGKTESNNQKELVAFLKTKPSSTTRLLDRMERDGWIMRQLNLNDRREMILLLTPKGQEIRNQCLPLGQEFSNQITKDISETDLQTFYRVFDQLIANVK
ncbi:MarR family transcriptional regulator [Eubacteriaceae bacterium ES3]|nr:MarR family transcriptional regulator [Eubacteriaceae bacterium ES3]